MAKQEQVLETMSRRKEQENDGDVLAETVATIIYRDTFAQRALKIINRINMGNANLEAKRKIQLQRFEGPIFEKPSQILRWADDVKIRKISDFLTDGENGYCARGIIQQYLSPDSDNTGICSEDLHMIGRKRIGKGNNDAFEIIHNIVNLNNRMGSTFSEVATYLEREGL